MRKHVSMRLLAVFLCALSTSFLFAQDKKVSGTVTDEKGAPLSGATVTSKNSKLATKTAANGQYTLTLPSGNAVLVVSYVGMEAQEVLVANRSVVDVSLKATSSSLSDVVVVGYGTRRRAEVTTSISSISAKDIKDLPVTGVDQAMQGKLAGVTVTNNSGQPGAGVSVRVRGITSVNNNEPLYVIDGVQINANSASSQSFDALGGGGGQTQNSILATINPNDIESIDVLKDASAQSIYGSQAANGVVIITTKKGRVGEGKVNYDTYYGWQNVQKKLDIMNLSEFAKYQNSVAPLVGLTPSLEFADPSVLGRGTDWQDAIFQRGAMQNHQLSFSGGANKTTYYVSANYFDQQGIIIGSKFKRYSLRLNLDQQVKTWMRAGINSNISKSSQKLTLADEQDGTITQALVQSPLIPIKNLDDSWGGPSTVGGITYYQDNPVAKARLRDVTSDQSKVFGSIYADISFLKMFSLRNELGFDFNLAQNTAFQKSGQIGTTPLQSHLIEGRTNSYFWVVRTYLNFNRNFGTRHSVTATIGHESQYSKYDYINAERYNLASNDLVALNTGSATGQQLGGGKGNSSMESYFARAGYTYDNRYSVNLSYRADASANFGPDNKWGYFPGASVGWTVTNESFGKKLGVVNYLKLRAGVGAVGNQSTPGGAPTPPYTANVRFTTNGFGAGSLPRNLANSKLKWESVVTQNIGIDASILNRKIDITVDVYKKVTKDMLLFSSAPTFTGLGSEWNDILAPIVNTGQMTNKGIDISVTSYNLAKKKFSWKTTAIFSHYKNNLDFLAGQGLSIDGKIVYGTLLVTHTVAGHPVGSFYGLVTDGLFRSQQELNSGLPQFGLPVAQNNGTWLGDVRFRDVNGDKVIDDKDATFIGSPHPKFTYGLTNTFQYKSLDLSIFLQGSYGAKILNWQRRYLEGLDNVFNNQLNTVSDRYTDANTGGSLPRFTPSNKNNTAVSDRWVEDGSYLRLQNVSIGYSLPKQIIRHAFFSSARIYVSGQNLHTFTNYSGYDPEIGTFNKGITLMNIDNGHYPNPRTITIGANLEF